MRMLVGEEEVYELWIQDEDGQRSTINSYGLFTRREKAQARFDEIEKHFVQPKAYIDKRIVR